MNIWELPDIPIPDKILKLTPIKYFMKYTKDEIGDKILILAKTNHVSVKITDADLLMTEEQLKNRILNPAIDLLERNSK